MQIKRGGLAPSSAFTAKDCLRPSVANDGSEDTVVFSKRTRGEEQRVGRAAGAAITKGQTPQTVDLLGQVIDVQHVAEPGAVARIVQSDQTATEVADQQFVGEPGKVRGRQNDRPRRI